MPVIYKRTPNVEDFFELFGEKQKTFDWDYCAERFKEHDDYKTHRRERSFQIDIYAGAFMAFYRADAIEEIRESNPELGISLVDKLNSKEYILGRDFCGRNFIYTMKGSPKAKYDNLLDINGTKTIINFWYRKFPKTSEEKSEFITDLFGEKIAYGIVITKDNLGKGLRSFEKRGGFILSLPFDKDELKESIRETCARHRLGIREEY